MRNEQILKYSVNRISAFENDIDKLADWYVKNNYNNQEYGDKFIVEVESVLENLKTFPFIHRRYGIPHITKPHLSRQSHRAARSISRL